MPHAAASASLVAFFVITLLAVTCEAWWGQPHMITADVARRHMSARALAEAERILGGTLPFYNMTTTVTPAAVWSDDVKEDGLHFWDSHHYQDSAYVVPGSGITPPEDEGTGVVWAMQNAVDLLSSRMHERWQEAILLRQLIHYAGDSHQPLHCISRFSTAHPKGDQGGNFVHASGAASEEVNNLHKFWDWGANLFPDYDPPVPVKERYLDDDLKTLGGLEHIANQSLRIVAAYPRSFFSKQEIEERDFSKWCEHSYNLAVQYAYAFDGDDIVISPEYKRNAQTVVQQQVALGGYRLAHVLNKVMEKHIKLHPKNSSAGKDNERPFLIPFVGTALLAFTLVAIVLYMYRKARANGVGFPHSMSGNSMHYALHHSDTEMGSLPNLSVSPGLDTPHGGRISGVDFASLNTPSENRDSGGASTPILWPSGSSAVREDSEDADDDDGADDRMEYGGGSGAAPNSSSDPR